MPFDVCFPPDETAKEQARTMWLASSFILHPFALLATTTLLLAWGTENLLTLSLHSSRVARAPKKAPAGIDCPKDWLAYEESCYGFFAEPKMWWDAEAMCQSLAVRSHLASVLNEAEMDAVVNFIRPLNQECCNGIDPIWIGLYDHNILGWKNMRSQGRKWLWMDSFKMVYLPWAEGEPNNRDYYEACVSLVPHKGYKKWNDDNCIKPFPYLCKYELKYQ